jgi:hypothetical protein
MAEESRPPAGPSVYQFKVTLKGASPPIWRRFQVTDDITLYRLHLVLQDVMGWLNYHLYQFTIGGLRYADPDPEYDTTDRNAKKYKLWQVFGGRQKAKALYEYDFGDSWEHELVLEKVLPTTEGACYPVCLAGARACPPEDCGGVSGYARLLDIIRNPEDEEYEETMMWLGGSFDPEAFDLDEVNARLAPLGRRARKKA